MAIATYRHTILFNEPGSPLFIKNRNADWRNRTPVAQSVHEFVSEIILGKRKHAPELGNICCLHLSSFDHPMLVWFENVLDQFWVDFFTDDLNFSARAVTKKQIQVDIKSRLILFFSLSFQICSFASHSMQTTSTLVLLILHAVLTIVAKHFRAFFQR